MKLEGIQAAGEDGVTAAHFIPRLCSSARARLLIKAAAPDRAACPRKRGHTARPVSGVVRSRRIE
jgi:hypothetical protein